MGVSPELSASMTRATNRIDEFLATDEPLIAVTSGRLTDSTVDGPVAIGLTDRRLVCVSTDGEFVDVRYDSVASIATRPETSSSIRGLDHRLAIGAGWLLAPLSFVAFVALAGWGGGPNGLVAALCAFLLPIAVGATAHFDRETGDEEDTSRETLLAGGASVLTFLAASVFAGSLVAPLLLFGLLAGVGLVDYGNTHRGQFDGIELVHRRERAIDVNTVDGRAVQLGTDSDDEIGRELSRLTNSDGGRQTTAPISPQPERS